MKYLWKIDDFDSRIFGFKSVKIIDLDPKRVIDVIEDLVKNKVSHAIIRVQSKDFQLVHALEQTGFILVDGLVSLSLNISSLEFLVAKEIREAKKEDLLQLKKMTINLYSNTRITNDSRTSHLANKYYTEWIKNSVKGEIADSVLVWEDHGEILGYVTLQKWGQIPLIGVSEKARGKGIAGSLLNSAFSKFKKWNVEKVNIDTQMSNIPALRAYHGVGFKIVGSYLTFRWTNL